MAYRTFHNLEKDQHFSQYWAGPEELTIQKLEPPYMRGSDWVKAPGVPERFLLSSYPLDGFDEYWEGVIVNKVSIGIQLATALPGDYHIREVGSQKEVRFGLLRLDRQTNHGGVVQRVYTVFSHLEAGERKFYHYELSHWNDTKTPDTVAFGTLMRLYELRISLCLNQMDSFFCGDFVNQCPLVTQVHCMSGAGRTGTFVLTRVMKCQQSQNEASDVLEHLRQQRWGLVETKLQFDFAVEQSKTASHLPIEREGCRL